MANELREQLDRKSARQVEFGDHWHKLELLYEGGCRLWNAAVEFLRKRPVENADVYAARRDQFTAPAALATAADYFTSYVFRTAPKLDIQREPEGKADAGLSAWWNEWQEDVDGEDTSLLRLFRSALLHVLLFRRAYLFVDLPDVGEVRSLFEQKEKGQFSPRLQLFSPRTLISHEETASGRLRKALFRTETAIGGVLEKPQRKVQWLYLDETEFRVYEAIDEDGKEGAAKLAKQGRHATADLRRLPVVTMTVDKGMWLGNRAFLPMMDLLNQDNALGWSLFMAALAVPVVHTDQEPKNLTLAEHTFVHLKPGDKYSYAEPQGTSWTAMAGRIQERKEEVFRAFYLLPQARTQDATPAAQTGFSKEMDYAPTNEVANYYGSVVRKAMQVTLNMVLAVRERGKPAHRASVDGYKFSEQPKDAVLRWVTDAMALGIPSPTFDSYLEQMVVQLMMGDAGAPLREKALTEVSEAQPRQERMQEVAQREADQNLARRRQKVEERFSAVATEREQFDGDRSPKPRTD